MTPYTVEMEIQNTCIRPVSGLSRQTIVHPALIGRNWCNGITVSKSQLRTRVFLLQVVKLVDL